jgi:hypothetical protein
MYEPFDNLTLEQLEKIELPERPNLLKEIRVESKFMADVFIHCLGIKKKVTNKYPDIYCIPIMIDDTLDWFEILYVYNNGEVKSFNLMHFMGLE